MSKDNPEKFYTIKEAASLLGLKYWQLQRPVKQGMVPSYTFGNSRKHVRLSEVNAIIERSRSRRGE
jgi:excisionase family DNA binding protein